MRRIAAPTLVEAAADLDAVWVAQGELAAGRMVLLLDDNERAGDGDLLIAAEFADAEAVNFLVTKARGMVSLALSAQRSDELGLEPIGVRGNASTLGDSAMVSVEAREGVTTGISAADRARTIAVATDPASTPVDLVQPGHVFPLRARPGGVIERPSRIEAAVELAAGSRLGGAAVLCEVMRDDGHVSRGKDLEAFAAEHGIAIVTLSEVVEHHRSAVAKNIAPPVEGAHPMREVMGYFATGVSVITTRGQDGVPVGTTVNAISSVSLDPPLVLACLARSSVTLEAIRSGGVFAINVLSAEQGHHSYRFAAKGDAVRAHEVEFIYGELEIPLLPGALATIACEVESIHLAGDHEIVVGRVRHLDRREPGADPLLFYRGSLSRLRLDETEVMAEHEQQRMVTST